MKSILLLLMATSCVVSPLSVTAQAPVLLMTFNNPTPAVDDHFGSAMAALGSDRVLIGAQYDDTTATNGGAVYLFHTNGTLLTTFTNPNPAYVWPFADDQFGCAIATLGSDRVLIGSPQSAKVYLFTTNGDLVTTINTTNYYDTSFGDVVAVVGDDRMLIGAPRAHFDPDTYVDYGAAYLRSTNGALLATFSNPNPEAVWAFGFSLAAFGSDRVLIGANEGWGAAYLFSTNGTLLTTITNPTPGAGDSFGNSVVAAGTDRILVGDYGDDTLAEDAGSVYVFNTNGTLLMTITNPTPAVNDRFGARMAMLGSDRVLINATGDDTAGPDAGSAYLFNLDGTLLATLNNPAPATGDLFGFRAAAFGSEGVIIGAPFDDAGATNAGSVYLFSVPAALGAPSLTIRRTTPNTVAVSWPSTAIGFALQESTNFSLPNSWFPVAPSTVTNAGQISVTVPTTVWQKFFRLKSQ